MSGSEATDSAVVARRARAEAEQAAVDAGRPDLAGDAALVITELVTNAVLHAGGCTAFHVRPTADGAGVRVEVLDGSAIPPVFGRHSEEALTGRGIRLVSSISAQWGVEPLPDGGKLVWAEVTGESPAAETMQEADLLAMWGEDLSPPAGDDRYHVELGDVPTDLLLGAKSHVENLAREFALATAGAKTRTTAQVPPHLVALLAAIDGFAEARQSIKRQALAALDRGAVTTRLALDLPISAASAGEEYLEALDEVDAYCRAARLLTLETPPQHRVFRQWYIGELVRQLRAAAAGEDPPPARPFESRLLDELEVLAEAQRATDRAARLYAVSAALAGADTPEAVAEVVLNEGVAALGASGGGVLLATDDDRLALRGAVGYDEAVVARLRAESRDAELPAAYALRTGEPVWLESRAERDSRFPDLVGMEATTVSLCAVPLEVQGRRLGALRFSFTEPRLFDSEERRFVVTLAALTAQALDRTQLQQARVDVSRRLQRSLLPPELPTIPRIEVGAVYHPFGNEIEVGGDFYDIWPIADGTWAVAIGDAAGTGPDAAAITAMVRYTLRALTLTTSSPKRVLQSLNTAMCAASYADDRFCTCMFGVVTPGDPVHLTLSSGGHPPVVVRRADGLVETVLIGGTLLGAFEEVHVAEVDVELRPGDTAVLLTDGMIEAHYNGSDQFGLERVLEVVAATDGTPGIVLLNLRNAVLAHTGGLLTDDMAAVALRSV